MFIKPGDALALGRVSNLPTVWTNMLAALVLVNVTPEPSAWMPLLISLSLFYTAGMYLNDAFDVQVDSIERPERPIPSGRVSLRTVITIALIMFVIGFCFLFLIGAKQPQNIGLNPVLSGLGLFFFIVLYNAWHKNNPLSPVLMGMCRFFVYLTTALCFVVSLPTEFWAGALALFSYLIGLTYIAKQEHLREISNMWPLIFLFSPAIYGLWIVKDTHEAWMYLILLLVWVAFSLRFLFRRLPGDIKYSVANLIAGMCLLDAMLIAGTGNYQIALLAVLGFIVTLIFQRFVDAT